MTIQFRTYDLPLSAAPEDLGQGIDQILVSYGPINLIDIDVTEPQGSPGQPTRTAVLVFDSPGKTLYHAAVFGDDTPDGDVAAINLFFQTYPQRTGVRLFDVSTLDLGKLRRGRSLLVFTNDAPVGVPVPGRQLLTAAVTVAPIAAGATGLVKAVYGDLTQGAPSTARNASLIAAGAGAYGYAFVDPATGDLIFFPTCI